MLVGQFLSRWTAGLSGTVGLCSQSVRVRRHGNIAIDPYLHCIMNETLVLSMLLFHRAELFGKEEKDGVGLFATVL